MTLLSESDALSYKKTPPEEKMLPNRGAQAVPETKFPVCSYDLFSACTYISIVSVVFREIKK